MDKKSIILKVFNQEYEGVSMKPPTSKSYKKNMDSASTHYSQLIPLLNSHEKELLDNYLDSSGRANSELLDQYFKEGFSLAVNLILDAIEKHSKQE